MSFNTDCFVVVSNKKGVLEFESFQELLFLHLQYVFV